ncbi:hypothetical protein ASF51_08070 [Agreia sp. Leaf283]|nr:hypothetical protein ASF51_08070 [Agreia sp. Leaf283]
MLRNDFRVLPRHGTGGDRREGCGEAVDECCAGVDENGGAVLGSSSQQGELGEKFNAFDPGGGPDRTGGGRVDWCLPVELAGGLDDASGPDGG